MAERRDLTGTMPTPKTILLATALLLLLSTPQMTSAFTASQPLGVGNTLPPPPAAPTVLCVSSSSSSSSDADTDTADSADPLGLTPELRKITDAFASIPDEKMRYKQLLFMANQLEPVDDAVRVAANKVPGCLSTVHVDATSVLDEERGVNVVEYVGDSDGLLTKGLVALLVRGLSGCTPDEIANVNPEFIHAAKISQSLTPGRNNGFLNMIAVMKRKAEEVAAPTDEADDSEEADGGGTVVSSFEEMEGKPMYNAIMGTLTSVLKPTSISLVDNSDQHAGHAGSKGWEESGESHFALEIVADAFDGLAAVKRHQLIYMLLGDTMQKIHALQISAKTPDEV